MGCLCSNNLLTRDCYCYNPPLYFLVKLPNCVILLLACALIILINYWFSLLHFTRVCHINSDHIHKSVYIVRNYHHLHWRPLHLVSLSMIPIKKSSFLANGGLFRLLEDLATILFTPSSFLLVDPMLVSTVGVAKGTSSHFKLKGGIPLVEIVVIVCPMILAILSLPEGFI